MSRYQVYKSCFWKIKEAQFNISLFQRPLCLRQRCRQHTVASRRKSGTREPPGSLT